MKICPPQHPTFTLLPRFSPLPDNHTGKSSGRLGQFLKIISINFPGPNQRPNLGIGQLPIVLKTLIQRLDIEVVLNREGHVRVGRPTSVIDTQSVLHVVLRYRLTPLSLLAALG